MVTIPPSPKELSSDPSGLLLRFALDESLDGQDATGGAVKATLQNESEPKWVAGKIGKIETAQQVVRATGAFAFRLSLNFDAKCDVRGDRPPRQQ